MEYRERDDMAYPVFLSSPELHDADATVAAIAKAIPVTDRTTEFVLHSTLFVAGVNAAIATIARRVMEVDITPLANDLLTLVSQSPDAQLTYGAAADVNGSRLTGIAVEELSEVSQRLRDHIPYGF